MNAEDVVNLYKLFKEIGIEVWINGGWGIDALLGKQTRSHSDLDIGGKEIDVHVFEFDDKGENIYGISYPKKSLTGTGAIMGQTVNCISPEFVIKFHENYEPKEKDYKDIVALCSKYGLKLPTNYKKS